MARLLLFFITLTGCGRATPRVVLYCAQDREFAETLLADFSRQTSTTIAPKFDTESTKSVGLVEELQREAGQPRCDVHWNNEIIGTIRLQRAGVLQPYRSPVAERFPVWARATDDTWTAFAARARVLLVNTERVPASERPTTLRELTAAKWRGRVAIAKPFFGTTATHAACLFAAWGKEDARTFYRDLIANDVQVLAGNKHVAESVGRGTVSVGMTDTDDAIAEVEAGRPVVIVYPDAAGAGTLFIPNTLALIKGSPNPEAGRKLIDRLLASEAQLAAGPSHQLPLDPSVVTDLPAGLATPATTKALAVDWRAAADAWGETQTFLRDLFAR